jgi:Ca-activated chloride channel family protein
VTRFRRLVVLLLAVVVGGCEDTSTPPAPPTPPPAAVSPAAPSETAPAAARVGDEGVASLARSFYFVLDGSGSMAENPAMKCNGSASSQFSSKIDGARWAIREFLQKVPPADLVGLYVFDGQGQREVVPLATNNREAFLAAVDRVRVNGGTPLAEAIIAGVDRLVAQRRRQLGYGEFRLVVVTDGEATGRRLDDGTSYALANRIPIYTIGFCVGSSHTLFRSSVAYRAANSAEEVKRGLEETLGELEHFDMKAFGGP